jgi:hypothetical protein
MDVKAMGSPINLSGASSRQESIARSGKIGSRKRVKMGKRE